MKTAIVTGGASGIGRAISRELAARGFQVAVADIREDPREGGTAVCDAIRAAGGSARFIAADIAHPDAAAALVAATLAWTGTVDVLVNNAAVAPGLGLLATTDEVWERTMAVNVTGPFRLSRHVMSVMMQQPVGPGEDGVRGRIINIGSQHGLIAAPDDFAYGISKAALLQMTRQLAEEGGRHGIVCNTVSPGKIDTGKGGPAMETRWVDYSIGRTPLRRMGRPIDVARAVAFVASDECSFTTGANLLVDGGWMAA